MNEQAVVAAYFPSLRTWERRYVFIAIVTRRAWLPFGGGAYGKKSLETAL